MARALDSQILVLAREGLRHVGGRFRLRVHGVSMLPSVWPGDTIEIVSCALQDVQPQEIVMTVRDDRVFLHRFVGLCGQDGFLLRGDSMPGPDPAYRSDAFLGRLVQITRMGRVIPLPIHLRPWTRAIGILLCYCDTARRIALEVHNWRISRTSSQPDTNEKGSSTTRPAEPMR